MQYVAPLVGAWIEILLIAHFQCANITSLPSWERGLKLFQHRSFQVPPSSLPSWERGLKSSTSEPEQKNNKVAPLVGAWIEINIASLKNVYSNGRSPRGSVD